MIWCENVIYTPSGWSKNQFKENNDDSLERSVFITKRFIQQSFNICFNTIEFIWKYEISLIYIYLENSFMKFENIL